MSGPGGLSAVRDRDNQLQAEEGRLAVAATVEAVVRHVIDGDTVELEDGTRVRILLVDAPEATRASECFGEAATQFARMRVTSDVVHARSAEPRAAGADLRRWCIARTAAGRPIARRMSLGVIGVRAWWPL